MAAAALLELAKLEVAYGGIQAVKGIDLVVRQGELVCLIGANGAGKTTTLKGITGLQPVKAGTIFYEGVDVTGKPAFQLVRKGLSMVPEGRGFFGALSLEDQQALAAYVRSLDATGALLRIRSNQNSLCVNIAKRLTDSGAKAIQYHCGTADNEVFSVNNVDGYLQFVVKHSGLCLAEGPVTTSPIRSLVQVACNSGAATQWSLGSTPGANTGGTASPHDPYHSFTRLPAALNS